MKRRALRLPATLAVAILGCDGDEPPKDATPGCAVYCVAGVTDAGVPPDGGCPLCADFSSGTPVCPSGCTPLG